MRYNWHDEIGAAPGTAGYFKEIDAVSLNRHASTCPGARRHSKRSSRSPIYPPRMFWKLESGRHTRANYCAAQQIVYRNRSYGSRGRYGGSPLRTVRPRRQDPANGRRENGLCRRPVRLHLELGCDSSFGRYATSTRGNAPRAAHRRYLHGHGLLSVVVAFYFCGFLRGIFQGQFRKQASLHRVTQSATDGAIARHYTPAAWRETIQGLFTVESIRIYGLKAEILPLPHSRLKAILERLIPNVVARLMTNRLRMGSFLVVQMRKL